MQISLGLVSFSNEVFTMAGTVCREVGWVCSKGGSLGQGYRGQRTQRTGGRKRGGQRWGGRHGRGEARKGRGEGVLVQARGVQGRAENT